MPRHRGGPGHDTAHRQHLLAGSTRLPDRGGPASEAGEGTPSLLTALFPLKITPGGEGGGWRVAEAGSLLAPAVGG